MNGRGNDNERLLALERKIKSLEKSIGSLPQISVEKGARGEQNIVIRDGNSVRKVPLSTEDRTQRDKAQKTLDMGGKDIVNVGTVRATEGKFSENSVYLGSHKISFVDGDLRFDDKYILAPADKGSEKYKLTVNSDGEPEWKISDGDDFVLPIVFTSAVGTGTFSINADGAWQQNGGATTFDDVRVAMEAVKVQGASNIPTYTKVYDDGSGSAGVYAYQFSQGDQVFFSVQLPHAMKENTVIFPHVHYITDGTNTGDVQFNLEYVWANIGESFSTTTSSISMTKTSGALANVHEIAGTSGVGITPNTKQGGISSMLLCRLERDSSDTYTGDPYVLEFDFHVEIDSAGSWGEYTK